MPEAPNPIVVGQLRDALGFLGAALYTLGQVNLPAAFTEGSRERIQDAFDALKQDIVYLESHADEVPF